VFPSVAPPTCRAIALFDHEEVGSASISGAGGSFLGEVIERLVGPACMPAVIRRSFLVSADMAHAVHPNYPSKHEEAHKPRMGGGVVVKHNANQRYATTNLSCFLFKRCAELAGVPVQEFVVRQDMGCGSTIGPIMSTRLGMRTVDVGVAQLSMHSIREMCAVSDIACSLELYSSVFSNFHAVDVSIDCDAISVESGEGGE
jgi:aspartyl aminopeptidase